ncbi:MAG: ATP-binding protein [Bacillota bacterium]|nr:ATP-binding protein [Bacillota bacterium]
MAITDSKRFLKQLIAINELLLQQSSSEIDYKMLSDGLLVLSGAKYVLLIIPEDDGKVAHVAAVSGSGDGIDKITEILDSPLMGMKWKVGQFWGAASREKNKLTSYDDLEEVSSGVVTKEIETLIKNTLGVESFFSLAVTGDKEEILADVVLAMPPGEDLANPEAIELFAGQLGMLLMRLKAEMALKKSEQEKATVLNSLEEQVLYLDPQFRIIWANPAATRTHNMELDEFLGRKCYEVWHDYSKPCPYCPVEKAINTGKIQIGETHAADGRVWKTTGVPVFDDSGELIGLVDTSMEITDLKKAEKELKKLNLTLEKKVAERTAELERVVKELDAFAYSVSHDLRAPLRSIDGFSQILIEDYRLLLDDEGKKYLEKISQASQRMGRLIDDLLKLSRVSRQELNHKTVDLSELVKQELENVREKIDLKEVETVIEPGLKVTGDLELLRIAVNNLIDNALKFSSQKKKPYIKFGLNDSEGKNTFYIRDNGAGFDMKYVDKLFTAFQRLHSPEEYPGSGIGLSIVSRILSRHGGEIWAEGKVGEGATFYFSLPGDADKSSGC